MSKSLTIATWVPATTGAILIRYFPKEWPFFVLVVAMAVVASMWLMLSVLMAEKK